MLETQLSGNERKSLLTIAKWLKMGNEELKYLISIPVL